MLVNIANIVHCDLSNLPNIKNPDMDNVKKACFLAKKSMSDFVYEMSQLEGNPFTFPEIQTLIDGVTVGGHKVSDEQQILNLVDSWQMLFAKISDNTFAINKETYCELQGYVARNEALEWGVFRNGSVTIAGTEFKPPEANRLDEIFEAELADLEKVEHPAHKAMLMFLAGCRSQFFWDGNKRTSRLMMTGLLISNGLEAISIPSKKHLEFNQKMVDFYDSGNGTEMMEFLIHCQPDLILEDAEESRPSF